MKQVIRLFAVAELRSNTPLIINVRSKTSTVEQKLYWPTNIKIVKSKQVLHFKNTVYANSYLKTYKKMEEYQTTSEY